MNLGIGHRPEASVRIVIGRSGIRQESSPGHDHEPRDLEVVTEYSGRELAGSPVGIDLVSTAKRAQQLLVDYAVHFVKADGKPRAKVFKLRRLELLPKVPMRLSGQVSFADLTTRRHYPGVHRIEVLINGVSRRLGSVDLY